MAVLWLHALALVPLSPRVPVPARPRIAPPRAAERLEFDALPAGLREATVTIDTGAVSTVDINLSGESIEALIARGRLATLELI